MSAEHGSSAQGRGSSDAGRPAGPAPHPASPADGSAWTDGADEGAAAWDATPRGDGSAWDDDAAESAVVRDAPVPAAASGWDAAPGAAAEVPRASVWDDDAPAPASSWDDVGGTASPVRTAAGADAGDASGPDRAPDAQLVPEPAPERPQRQRQRPRRTAVVATSDAADPAPTAESDAADPVQTAESDAVAAVAARLAEIVGRSGASRPPVVDPTTPAGDDPDLDDGPSSRGATSGRRGGGGSSPRAGAARRGGGRRRAPASEPPEDGAAAQDAEPDHESVARSVALRLLTGAPKSRHQLAEAMARRDVPEEVADRVLDRFTEVGLVDDAAYAEILVRSRHSERGLSRRALAQELRRRGVDDETAQEALEQVDDADEEQAARALARKKLRATRGLDRETRLRRAYGALGRRGYGGSLVSRVVREELDAEGVDDEATEHWSGGFGGG